MKIKNKFIVQKITDKNLWEGFIKESTWTPFFQSWAFGEAEKKVGAVLYRLGVFDKNHLVLTAQITLVCARRGTFLYLRHAPVFHEFNKLAFRALMQHIKKIAQQEHALFIRISPLLPADTKEKQFLNTCGFIDAPVHNQNAENCLILDLSLSIEELFSQFRKTTRYLIRRAEKEGVVVEQINDLSHLATFFDLYKKTATREHFVPHGGIHEEFEELIKNSNISLFIASHQNIPLAASLVVFYGVQAVYHHSGSTPNKVGANYLLQWEIIKEAKKRGIKFYNLWGIAPENKPHHPWQGLTLFKKGFGGQQYNFLHALDLPLSHLYWLSYIYQKWWSFKKGYL